MTRLVLLLVCILVLPILHPASAGQQGIREENQRAQTQSFDVTAPVREVLAVINKILPSRNKSQARDYFSEDHLTRLFSEEFGNLYRWSIDMYYLVLKHDEITGTKNVCPTPKLDIEQVERPDAEWDVVTRFQHESCLENQNKPGAISKIVFQVIEENGRPVIDDILAYQDDKPNSLKTFWNKILLQPWPPETDE